MLDRVFTLPALPVLEEETDADLERERRESLGLGPSAWRRTSAASSCKTVGLVGAVTVTPW